MIEILWPVTFNRKIMFFDIEWHTSWMVYSENRKEKMHLLTYIWVSFWVYYMEYVSIFQSLLSWFLVFYEVSIYEFKKVCLNIKKTTFFRCIYQHLQFMNRGFPPNFELVWEHLFY